MLILFLATILSAQESPKIINEFSGTPPVPGTIRNMAWGEAPEEYVVQSGDSLYDICDQLLAEGDYWPKLWALNPQIKNPHFIFPGTKIRFYSGDDEHPPFLQVVAEDDVVPVEKGNLTESELIKDDFQIPKDQILSTEKPVVPVLDSSQLEVPTEILSNIEVVGGVYTKSTSQTLIPGFIFKDEPETLATVSTGVDGQMLLGDTHDLYAKTETTLSAGTIYTILRRVDKIYHPDTDDFVGYRYIFVSQVRVVDVHADDDIVRGKVFMTRTGALEGDIIVSYKSATRTVSTAEVSQANGNSEAYVVGFEYAEQKLGGQGSFVFLTNTGVSPGQYFAIFQKHGAVNFGIRQSPPIENDEKKVGILQIIDVTDAGAIGYIVKSYNEATIGDRLQRKG